MSASALNANLANGNVTISSTTGIGIDGNININGDGILFTANSSVNVGGIVAVREPPKCPEPHKMLVIRVNGRRK